MTMDQERLLMERTILDTMLTYCKEVWLWSRTPDIIDIKHLSGRILNALENNGYGSTDAIECPECGGPSVYGICRTPELHLQKTNNDCPICGSTTLENEQCSNQARHE